MTPLDVLGILCYLIYIGLWCYVVAVPETLS